MDAETYLSQVRELHTTLRAFKMRLDEAKYTMDMLKSVNLDGLPKGEAKTLDEVIAEYEERMDEYVREMMRWTALKEQAISMLDRARTRLLDGSAHAIRVTHIDVVEMYYIGRMSREHVAYALDYSVAAVDKFKAEALVWLDGNIDIDGFPLVPVVSE